MNNWSHASVCRWLVFRGVLSGPRQDVGGAHKCPNYGGRGKGMYVRFGIFFFSFLSLYLSKLNNPNQNVILVEVIILLDITFLSWKKMHGPVVTQSWFTEIRVG